MDTIILKQIFAILTTILTMMSGLVANKQPVVTVDTTTPYLPTTSYTQKPKVSNGMLGAYNVSAGGTYRLQSSAGLSDTSIYLSSFKEPISNIPYTMAYMNTAIAYGTLDPANTTNKEFISFTGITQNSNGSAILTGVSRGLGFSSPFTASTTLQKTHSGQSIFILSNAPQVYNQFANRSNNDTITGTWAFTASPTVPTPVGSTDVVNKSYVDGGILAGAATATESVTGIVRLATAIQGASSTPTTANTPLVLQAQNATSTYNSATAGLKVVVTQNNGKIDPNFYQTNNHTWSGSNNFTANTGVGTSSPYTALSVVGETVSSNFTATSTTATSTFTNLRVSSNATTTNLVVSGTCTNCATNGWETITASAAGPASDDAQVTVTATCSAGKKVIGGGGTVPAKTGTGEFDLIVESKPSGTNAWIFTTQCNSQSAGTCTAGTQYAYAICVNQ